MRVGIVGSRSFNYYDLMVRVILQHIDIEDIDEIISGGAKGADRLGERFATINKIKKKIFYPDWSYGKQAGNIRNIKIVRNSDIVFAFWDGESNGTKNTIELCEKNNKRCIIQKFKGDIMNDIIMIDGNNIAHMCFNSAKQIVRKTDVEGEEKENFIKGMTQHIFLNKLFAYMKEFKGHYFITWDVKSSTNWRKEISSDYKSTRVYNSDFKPLFDAMDNLRLVLTYLPIYQYWQENVEADDILYKAASECYNLGSEITIMSNDSDMQQIVQQYPGVKQFNPKTKVYMEPPTDYDITIYKAFCGDSTDHVSGVPGIGAKTGEKYARELFGLSGYELRKKVKHLLKENEEKIKQFEQSFELVDIRSNPNIDDINLDLDFLYSKKTFDEKQLMSFFEQYNMKAQIKGFDKTIKLLNKIYND